MHGPTCIFWANLTPASPKNNAVKLLNSLCYFTELREELLGAGALEVFTPLLTLPADSNAIVSTRGGQPAVPPRPRSRLYGAYL